MKKKTWAMIISLVFIIVFVFSACTVDDPTQGTPAPEKPQQSESGSSDQGGSSGDSNTAAADGGSSAVGSNDIGDGYAPLRVKSDSKLKIGYLAINQISESTIRNAKQAQMECERRGWELVQDTNTTSEAEKERVAFERILGMDPDAIVFTYMDIAPIADLIVEARSKGIGVYSQGAELTPGLIVDIQDSSGIVGAKMADYALNRLEGKGDMVGFVDYTWAPRGYHRDITAAALFEKGAYDFQVFEHYAMTPETWQEDIHNAATGWLTKYGDRVDFIWICWDGGAIQIAQVMADFGFTEDDMFTVGIDGGSEPWTVIRDGKIPFVASLASAFEWQVHTLFESVDQLQVQGMKPGTAGCTVPSNRILTSDGMCFWVDKTNVPPVGTNIHAVFNYYGGSPDDPDAWYNYGTPYTVQESA